LELRCGDLAQDPFFDMASILDLDRDGTAVAAAALSCIAKIFSVGCNLRGLHKAYNTNAQRKIYTHKSVSANESIPGE
jgi:hypothetical protein